jgi:hypothetical protein
VIVVLIVCVKAISEAITVGRAGWRNRVKQEVRTSQWEKDRTR